jgi:O-antigen ligase
MAIEFPRILAFAPGFFALIGLAVIMATQKQRLAPPYTAFYFMLPIIILCGASVLWSITPETSLHRVVKCTPAFLSGLIALYWASAINKQTANKYLLLLSAGLILSCLLVLSELNFSGAFHRVLRGLTQTDLLSAAVFNRGINTMTLCAFAGLAYLFHIKKNLVFGLVTLALLATVLVSSDSQSALLAFIIGIAVFYAFPYRYKAAWATLIIIICLGTLTAPLLAIWLFNYAEVINTLPFLGGDRGYAGPRLEIWDYVARYALNNPLYGFGLEATRAIENFDSHEIFKSGTTILHPHNFALQLWIEFGLIGATIGAAWLGALVYLISKQRSILSQRICLATLIATLSIASMGYGIWQGWWIGMLFYVCATIIVTLKTIEEIPETQA